MNDVREHANCIAISWYIHGTLMDDIWTLGQEYLFVAQIMCK